MYFDELDLNDDILDALDTMNFVECTPVQAQAIPLVLQGRDLLASAQTGTGKTAAYLLPILEQLSRGDYQADKVNVLVLVPTRELAQQVDQLLAGFAYYQDTTWFSVYGGNDGVAFGQQQRAMLRGGDICIATPGRLLSLLRVCKVDLSHISHLVLDEADRMLDIGFYDDIMEIISHLPSSRQTLMFSATFPKDVERLARQVLRNPAEVKIAVSRPADRIRQSIYLLQENQKIPLLLDIFSTEKHGKAIIFLSSKQKVKELYHLLRRRTSVGVAQIHSDLENAQRTQVLLDFKNNKTPILVATDVVARGIDIDDISLVVNYDVPFQSEDYVHRIGRTARAGADGEAITLVTPQDRFRWDKIERFLEKQILRNPMPESIASLASSVDDVPSSKSKAKRRNQKSSQTKNSSDHTSRKGNSRTRGNTRHTQGHSPKGRADRGRGQGQN